MLLNCSICDFVLFDMNGRPNQHKPPSNHSFIEITYSIGKWLILDHHGTLMIFPKSQLYCYP